jgi:Carboxypeptidase regulatory-like domain
VDRARGNLRVGGPNEVGRKRRAERREGCPSAPARGLRVKSPSPTNATACLLRLRYVMGMNRFVHAGWIGLLLMGMVAPRLCAQAGGVGDSRASIEGVVVSMPSGAAIRHADVELFAGKNEEPAYSVETDAEGRFSFADVATGEYRFYAAEGELRRERCAER